MNSKGNKQQGPRRTMTCKRGPLSGCLISHYDNFRSPPRDYSPTPIWWWIGDKLEEDRIARQLDAFQEGGIYNVVLTMLGPQHCSLQPDYFSEPWWDLWTFTCEEALKRSMKLWFLDESMHRPPRGVVDVLARHPEFASLNVSRLELEAAPPAAKAPNEIHRDRRFRYLVHRDRSGGSHELDLTRADAASALIDSFHGELDRRLGRYLGKVIAGTFQDELSGMPTWSETLPSIFLDETGLELNAEVGCLFEGDDDHARYIRTTYRRLMGRLVEEAYFRPLADWHRERGLLWSCDQGCGARTGDPLKSQSGYHDYVRTHRWFSVPGSDHNGDTRLHAALAQHHGGSRVWLEAFHSSGWGGTLEETTRWLLPWLADGATLFDPHAVYYSTRGGWFEWAPPDTGWRQPYWKHHPAFANYVARLCYILSYLRREYEVAVMYPTTASQAEVTLSGPTEEGVRIRDIYWQLVGTRCWRGNQNDYQPFAGILEKAGIGFDIVDELSIATSSASHGFLQCGDFRYHTILLPGTKLVSPEVARQLMDFIESGGRVLAVEASPDCPANAELNGDGADLGSACQLVTLAELSACLDAVEPETSEPAQILRASLSGHPSYFIVPHASYAPKPSERDQHLVASGNIPPDATSPLSPPPEQIAFTLHDADPARHPVLWDAASGERIPLAFQWQESDMTIEVPLERSPAALVILEPDGRDDRPSPQSANAPLVWEHANIGNILADYLPTMDNRDGDFTLPAHPGPIPITLRTARLTTSPCDLSASEERMLASGAWTGETVTLTHGPRLEVSGPLPVEEIQAGQVPSTHLTWRTAVYSERYGLEKDPLYCQLLGTKGYIPPDFFDLGGRAATAHAFAARTWLHLNRAFRGWLRMPVQASTPRAFVDGNALELADVGEGDAWFKIELDSGRHQLAFWFFQEGGVWRSRSRGWFQFLDEKPTGSVDTPHSLRYANWLGGEQEWTGASANLCWSHVDSHPGLAWFALTLPPGARALCLPVTGRPRAWIDGKELPIDQHGACWRVETEAMQPAGTRKLILAIPETWGDRGAGVFVDFPYVDWQDLGTALLPLGDWCDYGLRSYSGGMRYTMELTLDADTAQRLRFLDLGRVRGTASVSLNGTSCAVRIWAPYRVPVPKRTAREGVNRIQVEVYNTLANHFGVGHPSPYGLSEQEPSGLMGPLHLVLESGETVELEVRI